MSIFEEFRKRGYAPGEYFNKCSKCGQMFVGDKKAWTCFSCAAEQVGNVAKPDACAQLRDVNPQIKTISIEELRSQFEHEYIWRMFSLERDNNGQYMKTTTFQAWCAYKLCAALNGLLPEGFDIYSKGAD